MKLALVVIFATAVACNKLPSAQLNAQTVADNKIASKHGPQLDWWQNAIFYQIYPRSFKDSDGDGIGDIQGIISKLEHLKELGIAGTWLSPIFKSPMADFGYDISNFYDIDPIFGTIADMEELFRKANKLGLKIILDFVPNHTSEEAEWFKKSVDRIEPFTDFYIWHNGKNVSGQRAPPNNWQSAFYGSAWTWNEKRQQYYLHQFVKEQPDLNFRNPLVVEEMKDVIRFWLEKGAGGFRVDAIGRLFEVEDLRDEPLSGRTSDPLSYDYTDHHYTRDLDETYDMVYQWRKVLDDWKAEHGGDTRIMMTEANTNLTFVGKFYGSHDGKRNGSHMPFNFELIMSLSETSSAHDFKRVIEECLSIVPEGQQMNWVIGNHDRARVGSRYGEGKIDALLTLVMTLPGIAVTYMGEEIGMLDNRNGISYQETFDPKACNLKESDNWRELSRDPQRTPFQWDATKWAGFSQGNQTSWLPIHPNYKDVNLQLQKELKRSTYKYYLQLAKLRLDHSFIYGDYQPFVVGHNVLAYSRSLGGHATYIVLINFGAREETVDVNDIYKSFGDHAKVVVAGADTPYNAGDHLPAKQVFLRKYNTVVLQKAAPPKKDEPSSASSFTMSLALIIASFVRLFL